jgi:hypothetical protein
MIETRTYQLPDGSREIVRILNDEVLGVWTPKNPLAFEKSIVWQQPIDELDFVRVAVIRNATSRRGPIVARGVGMAVGYSKLTVDAPRDPNTGFFTRRLFYLKEEDLLLNLNQIPPGVIDPKTLLPGSDGKAPKMQDLNRGYPWWACRPETPSVAAVPVAV